MRMNHRMPLESAKAWSWRGRAIRMTWDPKSMAGYVKAFSEKVRLADVHKLSGEILAGKHDLMGLLQAGNCIGVKVCAQYTGWELYGRAAFLVLEMGSPTIIDQPPSYVEVYQNTIAVQQLLNCVNANNSAYTPKIKAAWDRAETFAGNEKRPLRVLALGEMTMINDM